MNNKNNNSEDKIVVSKEMLQELIEHHEAEILALKELMKTDE